MSHYEERLERDLGQLREHISSMARMVEEGIKNAMHALQTGNKKLAAHRLGIHRSTLYAKIRRYGLDDDEGAGEPGRSDPRQHVPESATPVSSAHR